MALESLEAWVLHKKPIGDTSIQVILFTREKGIVYSIYQGGRAKKKHPFLQSLTPLWVAVAVRKQDKHYIQRIENAASPLSMQGKNTLFSSFYMNELLYYVLRPLDSHAELFSAYSETLFALSLTRDSFQVEALIRKFEKNLLKACGQMVSFTKAAYSEDSIVSNQRYNFLANAGFFPDEDGILLGKDILACAQDHFDSEDKQTLKIAKFIMRQAVDFLLEGRVIRSRELFSKLG